MIYDDSVCRSRDVLMNQGTEISCAEIRMNQTYGGCHTVLLWPLCKLYTAQINPDELPEMTTFQKVFPFSVSYIF